MAFRVHLKFPKQMRNITDASRPFTQFLICLILKVLADESDKPSSFNLYRPHNTYATVQNFNSNQQTKLTKGNSVSLHLIPVWLLSTI